MCFTDSPAFSEQATKIPSAILERVPRDQALGLRLIALARAAAALHMAQVSRGLAEKVGAGKTEGGDQ